MKKLIIALFCCCMVISPSRVFAFSLFENKYISQVKNGAFKFDTSLSIGEAFDNYKYFDKTEWEFFESEQGRKVVEFSGYFDVTEEIKKDYENIKNNLYNNLLYIDGSYIIKHNILEIMKVCLSDVEKCPIELERCKYNVQFIINREGFNVGYIGYEMNGVEVKKSEFHSIQDIYANTPFRDFFYLRRSILCEFDKLDEDLTEQVRAKDRSN